MSGQKQHVDFHRKILLRKHLLEHAVDGPAYVPFIGDGGIAAELYQGRKIYGVDSDPDRVAAARRALPDSADTIVCGDAEQWHFDEGIEFSVADFDAYNNPYPAVEVFLEHASLVQSCVIFGTDGRRQAIARNKASVGFPDGVGDSPWRKQLNNYWTEHVEPYLASKLSIASSEKYLRKWMLYWGILTGVSAEKVEEDADDAIREALLEAAKSGNVNAAKEYMRLRDKMDPHQKKLDSDRLSKQRERRESQDIAGDMPDPQNVRQRNRAIKNFRYFCERYFPESFKLKWCHDHLRAIEKIERATVEGGLFAFAMPRGSGKTTLIERAALWSVLTGRHPFVAAIGADLNKGAAMLRTLKMEIETNDLLYKDFPREIHPFRKLEGEARKCTGQRYEGERTYVGWKADEIVFGHVPDSLASGAVIRIAGLEASIRGMKHALPSGESARPSLVLLDDPQTRESARSASQCETREAIVAGDVLGMAGPGKKLSALMACTVIEEGDLADKLLNRDKHPQWQGERTKMLHKMPDNTKLWDEYHTVLADSLKAEQGISEATKFYRRNKKAMDFGAEVAWPQRKNWDEISGLQHAMNLLFQDRSAFFAEYQNDPLPREEIPDDHVPPDVIAEKNSGLARRTAPLSTTHVTAFIDVQQKGFYWVLCAWEQGFTGVVVDYGTYPDQQRQYFTLHDFKPTLQKLYPKMGLEAQIYTGLDDLIPELLEPVKREDGTEVDVDLCMVDAGWQSETVRTYCRRSPNARSLMPSHGHGVTAASEPLGELTPTKRQKSGERYGLNWKTSIRDSRKHLIYDTNFWKSFVHARLGVAIGDKGSLSLFDARPVFHRCFSEHVGGSEFSVRTEGRGRAVYEWKQRTERPDNHWFDCVVGAAAAASYLGVSLDGTKRRRPAVAQSRPAAASRPKGNSFFVTAR